MKKTTKILAPVLFMAAGMTFADSVWQQQTGWVMAYEHDASGSVVSGDIATLVDAVQHGADVKISMPSGKQEAFAPCTWTTVKEGYVSCMNTQHISIRSSEPGSQFGFQDNAYHWFVMLNTEGQRDMSRWSVGEHTDRGHSQDTTAIKWWVRVN